MINVVEFLWLWKARKSKKHGDVSRSGAESGETGHSGASGVSGTAYSGYSGTAGYSGALSDWGRNQMDHNQMDHPVGKLNCKLAHIFLWCFTPKKRTANSADFWGDCSLQPARLTAISMFEKCKWISVLQTAKRILRFKKGSDEHSSAGEPLVSSGAHGEVWSSLQLVADRVNILCHNCMLAIALMRLKTTARKKVTPNWQLFISFTFNELGKVGRDATLVMQQGKHGVAVVNRVGV